ncbi:SPOR domain-containing protein [Variovorax sp. J22P168]|uniref:SPOR domain-containing protein n=1 Tax=Variovorax jilinensis TaxID=3053513 RepID=UPI0025766995|nr:SPOR domain-containing protein [Variovorax sp. J22P168]MDM0011712.1 SPOR domain-containing protein [Variovorax sp. J22P168]
MAFFKFRNRGPQGNEGRSAAATAPPAESIEALRRRARHRLLGAAVLVLIGVVGFPLLFDTQPRPISVDIPIEIPDRNKAKPLVLPTPPVAANDKAAAPPAATPAPAPAPAHSGSAGMITESADGSEIPAGKLAASETATATRSEPAPETKAAPKPEPRKAEIKAEAKPEPKPEAKPAAPKPAPLDDAARARALLEGKSAPVAAAAAATAAAATAPTAKPSDENGRFVVQVGAFADADKAREVRQKLEKSGLKTYTSVAKTADGERTRVRVGPFASRAEADKAAGKVKGLSLPAAVLSL